RCVLCARYIRSQAGAVTGRVVDGVRRGRNRYLRHDLAGYFRELLTAIDWYVCLYPAVFDANGYTGHREFCCRMCNWLVVVSPFFVLAAAPVSQRHPRRTDGFPVRFSEYCLAVEANAANGSGSSWRDHSGGTKKSFTCRLQCIAGE